LLLEGLMTPRPLLLLFTVVGACATTAHPMDAEGPTSAIRAAEEVGAAGVPAAALRLQLAKEQLDHARTMTAEGQAQQADLLLMRSQADAELAVALARSSVARAEAQKAVERTKSIQGTIR
jgi:hypothetical protein